MMSDPAMGAMTLPYDGARLIFGGFEALMVVE